MITHVIWDLGDTLINPPDGGTDFETLDEYPEIQLRPGADVTLHEIQKSGYIQAVLSNTAASDSDVARRVLKRLGVADMFAFIYATQSQLTHDKPEKPDPEVFQLVLDALHVSPNHCVMVGNSWDSDIVGAHRSGIHAIWLQNPSVSVRLDGNTPIKSPPWVLPVWDIVDVPKVLQILRRIKD